MKINDIIFLLLFFLMSCNEPLKENKNSSNTNYNIKINPDKAIDIKISDIYDSIYMVPLETNKNCLIEHIEKLFIVKKNIIILDNGRTNSQILHFDHSGKFQNKIGSEGKGPGEYYFINDIDIYNNNIYILDANRKIICYSINNHFIDEFNTNIPGNNLCILNDSTFLISNNGGLMPNKKDGYYIYKINKKTILNKSFKIPNELLHSTHKDTRRLLKFNNEIYYIKPFSNIVYKYTNNNFEAYVTMDFESHYQTYERIINSLNKKYSPYEYAIKLQIHITKNNIITGLSSYIETEKHIKGSYTFKKIRKSFIYNKITGKTIDINTLSENEKIFTGINIKSYVTNDFEVYYMFKSNFENLAKYLKKNKLIYNVKNPVTYFKNNMNIEDNPVLIYTHLNPKVQ